MQSRPQRTRTRRLMPSGLGVMLACGLSFFGAATAPPRDLALPISVAQAAHIQTGHELMLQFQCNRCHDGPYLQPAAREKHCVTCHQEILAGRFRIDGKTLSRWQKNIHSLPDAPSLHGIDRRLRRDWIASYLQQPHDLRPGLIAMMPRLSIGERQAVRIATWLVSDEAPAVTFPADAETLRRGRQLIETQGCGTCHRFTGVEPLPASPLPVAIASAALAKGVRLAPDLRHTRDRVQSGQLVRWLRDPQSIKPDSAMPKLPLSIDQATAIAAYLFLAPLAPQPKPVVPARLPLLQRRVSFAEVNEQVFRRTCWHCHSTPEFAMGDGGPGNTGGFGFAGRGLNLATYSDVLAGSLDDQGERRSIFVPQADGSSILLRALLARQRELAGEIVPGVRGMPLGLPALSPEQIQLVESWIAQGRPQ